jgi:putative spermidine/putrescine transport system substrate-binding protein
MSDRTPMTRRSVLKTAGALGATAAVGRIAMPAVARGEEAVLRITTWGGKWGEIMKGEVLPAFEKEHKCKVEVDSAFPYYPKLLASPRSKPIYDVFHTNSNEQWAAVDQGLIEPHFDQRQVPNIVDVYPYAVSDKIVGVSIFTSAVGLAYRTDKLATAPLSWKDLWDAKYAGVRGSYVVPANALGQMLLMFCGKLYGGGYQDVDAGFKALERLKPVRQVDFTGTMEKILLAGEVTIGELHDSGVYRYNDQNPRPPLAFVAPTEGVFALEQVLAVTKGSDKKELGYAYVNYMLSPAIQRRLSEYVWYSPSNRKVTLGPEYQDKLLTTEAKVATLIQFDWKWYNARADEFNDRYNRLFRG